MARRPTDPPADPDPEQHSEPFAEEHAEQRIAPMTGAREVSATPEPRRRWSGWSFAAGAGLVAAVVLLAGGTSWVVARAAAATPESVVATSAPHAAMKGHLTKTGIRAVRGSITAIDRSTWTVTSRKGITVSVTVGAATQYGRSGSPAAVSDFRVGQSVVVVGTGKDGKIAAKRVFAAPAPRPSATPTT